MQYHKMYEVCEKAIDKYGLEAQALMATEELSELITAICHMLRGRDHNMPEEIADVEIMLLQLKICLNCFEEVEKQKDFKLKRLESYMGEEDDSGSE